VTLYYVLPFCGPFLLRQYDNFPVTGKRRAGEGSDGTRELKRGDLQDKRSIMFRFAVLAIFFAALLDLCLIARCRHVPRYLGSHAFTWLPLSAGNVIVLIYSMPWHSSGCLTYHNVGDLKFW
jgi:hypothetical protein